MHSHPVVAYTAFEHTHTHRCAHRRWHFKAFSPLWGRESSVTDPGVQKKDLSFAVILSSQTRGFCMGGGGLCNLVWGYLFISSVISSSVSIMRLLVRQSTMHFKAPQWWIPLPLYMVYVFDLWYKSDTLLVQYNSTVLHTDVIPAHCRLLACHSLLCLEKGRTLECTSRAAWLN